MALRHYDEMQLRFDLPELDEVQEDAVLREISPEQARMISETARRDWEARGPVDQEKSSWFEEYLLLIKQGWPWRVASYIAWASTPKIGRWPATLEDLARQVLGLTSSRAIYNWRRKHPSIDTVISQMQSKILQDHTADVFKALVTNA